MSNRSPESDGVSYPGPHRGCDTPHPHTHTRSQSGPTPDDDVPPEYGAPTVPFVYDDTDHTWRAPAPEFVGLPDPAEMVGKLFPRRARLVVEVRASLEDTRRHWVAYMLAQYPDRELLGVIANTARASVSAEAVEINALYDRRQITVASAPPRPRTIVGDQNSLCVLTVGAGRPLAVDDIRHDRFLDHHSARKSWGAWASAPLVIQGHVAGTICALEHHEREWTRQDEQVLTYVAGQLSVEIERWIDSERSS